MEGKTVEPNETTTTVATYVDPIDAPITEVTIYPALAYGCLVFVVPAHKEQGTVQWGAFIALEHARQLYEKLGQALAALEG